MANMANPTVNTKQRKKSTRACVPVPFKGV